MSAAPIQSKMNLDIDLEANEQTLPSEQIARHYIDCQVEKARRSLRRTRIFCVTAAFLILGYMSFLTFTIRNQLLRPQAAAEVASYYFSKFSAQNSLSSSKDFGTVSRELFTPGLATPVVKQAAESRYAFTQLNRGPKRAPSPVQAEVASYVQGFISHHGDVQGLFLEAQHPKTVQELTFEFDQEIRLRLPSREQGGYPNNQYLSTVEERLETLTELEGQLNRMARNQDLTPYEKTVRRVIASTMGNFGGNS